MTTESSGPIKQLSVNIAASADLVSLVADKKIRVLAYVLGTGTTTTLLFQSGGSTALTGAISVAADNPVVAPFNPAGWFETAAGEKLNVVLGASVSVDGHITYQEC